MDLTFPTAGGRFNVRIGVVVIVGDRLLLQGDRRVGVLVPPGGRCRLHESSRDAAEREMREELGRSVEIGRLLWVIESFFGIDGVAFHELGFVYEGHLDPVDPLVEEVGEFAGAEADEDLFFRWVPVGELGSLEIYPQVLRSRCRALPATVEHVVIDPR